MNVMYDVAVIGGGMSGMATAARLQRRGLTTIVLEAHRRPGGCAGFFRRRGFSFDVGATTLVDFESPGVGGELLDDIGLQLDGCAALPGYVAWLPDRTVVLHRERQAWARERLRMLGDTSAHRSFWTLLDHLADVFWDASRHGAKLPLKNLRDIVAATKLLGVRGLPAARYLRWTLGDALQRYALRNDRPLCGLLSMLVEDTVHSTLDDAPLINAALGITIRGAGLSRMDGGMRGFWRQFGAQYCRLGGVLRLQCFVSSVTRRRGAFQLETSRGIIHAGQVVSSVPTSLTAGIAAPVVGRRLDHYLQRDAPCYGGALVAFLGVPEVQVAHQSFTHHQLMHDYDTPLGEGNNMFVSVSSPDDLDSAPAGCRAVMISTHCELGPWNDLPPQEYERRKAAASDRLIELTRRIYPQLARPAIVCEAATPRTFAHFTRRPNGAVGGVRQSLSNSNQHAVPHDIGVPGFYLVGDTTWPGLGTVACVLGSRIVAGLALEQARINKRSEFHGDLRIDGHGSLPVDRRQPADAC